MGKAMAKTTGISWADSTWNPWQGCRKVSPGCQNCYMYREKERWGQDPTIVVRSKPATFNAPLRWKEPARVFVCSWSDFFIKEADKWRDDAYRVMRAAPQHTYLLLTKREWRINLCARLPADRSNIWLGTSIEREGFGHRIDYLGLIDIPVRFLSLEPLLGPLPDLNLDGIKWVIVGGESGPNARPMNPDWARDIRDQCQAAGVPFFMKQMSKKAPIPDDLMIREFPNVVGEAEL